MKPNYGNSGASLVDLPQVPDDSETLPIQFPANRHRGFAGRHFLPVSRVPVNMAIGTIGSGPDRTQRQFYRPDQPVVFPFWRGHLG